MERDRNGLLADVRVVADTLELALEVERAEPPVVAARVEAAAAAAAAAAAEADATATTAAAAGGAAVVEDRRSSWEPGGSHEIAGQALQSIMELLARYSPGAGAGAGGGDTANSSLGSGSSSFESADEAAAGGGRHVWGNAGLYHGS
eukprot:SAG22_NODE_1016_length_6022_cov_13.332095_2_plen_147_part_00